MGKHREMYGRLDPAKLFTITQAPSETTNGGHGSIGNVGTRRAAAVSIGKEVTRLNEANPRVIRTDNWDQRMGLDDRYLSLILA